MAYKFPIMSIMQERSISATGTHIGKRKLPRIRSMILSNSISYNIASIFLLVQPSRVDTPYLISIWTLLIRRDGSKMDTNTHNWRLPYMKASYHARVLELP